MTLTIVVGNSGSGKTTFLEHVHESHHCTYIRQYHNVRPFVIVSKIPNFDPTKLPYWDIYVNEGKDQSVMVGGTMAGEYTAGLSGGQRKLLLFELICQRTAGQKDLLLVFDEPFAGVTDNFVPYIVDKLNVLRRHHNILMVTNDHVETLKKMADNTITVSAIDRTKVTINDHEQADRERTILALSKGKKSQLTSSSADIKFFLDVELFNASIVTLIVFSLVSFGLFLVAFWDSPYENGVLIATAGMMVSFFGVYPYLITLTEWRAYMNEEAEALIHASRGANKALKTILVLVMILANSALQWVFTNIVIDGFEDGKFWFSMLMESFSTFALFIMFGLFTGMSFHEVELFGFLPFLFVLLFSTTYSPGGGVEGVDNLRFLFARYYYFCLIPTVQDDMEGCPSSQGATMAYMTITGILGVILFLIWLAVKNVLAGINATKEESKKEDLKDDEFHQLQQTLYNRSHRKLTTYEEEPTNIEPQIEHSV